MEKTIKGTLKNKEFIAKDVLHCAFELDQHIGFEAGQFLMLHINEGGKPIKRAFSIASAPKQNNIVEFIIKRYENGIVSNIIANAKEKLELNFSGPFGRMKAETKTTPMTFIATGVGIAPFFSIIKDQLENKSNKEKITLIFGVRNKEDILLQNYFEELENNFKNFTFILTLSKPNADWVGKKGRVTEYVKNIISQNNELFFICGNPEMVKETKKILEEEKQIPKKQIIFEAW